MPDHDTYVQQTELSAAKMVLSNKALHEADIFEALMNQCIEIGDTAGAELNETACRNKLQQAMTLALEAKAASQAAADALD